MNSTRPIVVVLASHWASLAGTVIVTTAGLLWLFALPASARAHADNPYTGIVLFFILPIVFVLENNQYAYSTPLDQQFAVDPVERAAAYGFPGISVDGNDPEAMFEATRQARERALAGEGPTLLEAVTMRMHGHAAHDDMKYVPKAQVEEWAKKDPIDRQSRRLVALGVDVEALRAEVQAEIEAGVQEALASPMPDPATATDRVFYEGDEDVVLGDGRAPWSGFAAASDLAEQRSGLPLSRRRSCEAGSDEGAVS